MTAVIACRKIGQAPEISDMEYGSARGRLSLTLVPTVNSGTKASYPDLEAGEAKINSAQVLICKTDGSLARYLRMDDVSGNSAVFEGISLPTGQYEVHALLNGKDMSSCRTASEFLQTSYSLDDNAGGFVHYAGKPCTVSAGQESDCRISARRLVARVHLQSVRNNLPPAYGTVTLKNVFLENVVAADSPGQNVAARYVNLYGRTDPGNAATVINGQSHPASAPAFTFKSVSKGIANGASYSDGVNLYCYRNSSTIDPEGIPGGNNGAATKLVLTVNINGRDFFYPVFISENRTIEANKAYTVSVTLNNIGSEDPSVPVTLSAASVTLSVDAWDDGGLQDVEI